MEQFAGGEFHFVTAYELLSSRSWPPSGNPPPVEARSRPRRPSTACNNPEGPKKRPTCSRQMPPRSENFFENNSLSRSKVVLLVCCSPRRDLPWTRSCCSLAAALAKTSLMPCGSGQTKTFATTVNVYLLASWRVCSKQHVHFSVLLFLCTTHQLRHVLQHDRTTYCTNLPHS